MRIHRDFIIVLLAAALMSGCTGGSGDMWQPGNGINNEGDNEGGTSTDDTTETPSVTVPVDPDNEEDFVENMTVSTTVRVTFSAGSATVEIPSSVGEQEVLVTKSGAGVTLTSTIKGVEYIVSGASSNGFLKIYSDYKFRLELNGASVTNPAGPAINIQSGKRCFLVLAAGTTSELTDGAGYTANSTEDQKGCLFSEGEIIVSGTGSLNVTGKYKHGICSDDYVRIREGSVTVKAAAGDGIHTNDAFIMDGGTLSVTCSSDGIECDEGYVYIKGGTVTVAAGDDGIVTSYEGTDSGINKALVIGGGKVTVTTTAQKGHALKSTGDISISGGTHIIKTTGIAAKGIKADKNVLITGGTTTVTTSGGGMVESGDTSSATGVKTGVNFGMTGGTFTVSCSGNGAKGISTGGSFVLDDGTLSVTTTGANYTSGSLTTKPKGVKANGYITVGGGSCTVNATWEGMESVSRITINGGTVDVTAKDDGLNVKTQKSSSIVINGGLVYVFGAKNSTAAKPGDGIDSNGTLTVTGGVLISSGGASPDEGFDCDQNAFTITGGIMIGTGGGTSYPNAGTQHSIIYGGSSVTLGEWFQLQNSSGAEILTYAAPRAYSSMTMFLSHSSITKSSSYKLVRGGTYSGGKEIFKGYYTGGTYTGGTTTSITTGSSYYTSAGTSSGGGGNPGGGGGPGPR